MSTIASIETHVFNVSAKTNWVFIAITAADGRTGWGEASLIGWEPMLVAASQALALEWQGRALADAQAGLRVSPQSPGGLVFNTVISAVQQALACLLDGSVPDAPAAPELSAAVLRQHGAEA